MTIEEQFVEADREAREELLASLRAVQDASSAMERTISDAPTDPPRTEALDEAVQRYRWAYLTAIKNGALLAGWNGRGDHDAGEGGQ